MHCLLRIIVAVLFAAPVHSTERSFNTDSIVRLLSLPDSAQSLDLSRYESSSKAAIQAATEHRDAEALRAERDRIAKAWVHRLRTARYAALIQDVERVAIEGITQDPAQPLEPTITSRHAARDEVFMGPRAVWTAAWVKTPDGHFDADRPQMKLLYEGGPVRERAWNAERGWYESTYDAPWHEWGADDFKAIDYPQACMVGSCTQSWLGASPQADHYVDRLADTTLLPGIYHFNGQDCRVLRYYSESVDPKSGEIDHSTAFDYFFNEHDILVGRDACVRNITPDRRYRIIERSVNQWTFHDAEPPRLAAFRNWLLDGPENPATATINVDLPLVGTLAPNLELPLLDGPPTTLAGLTASGPVILDFWATWCPPCRTSLPFMAELAREHRPQGLHVISIDLREDEQKVRAYLREHDLDLTVVIDADGALAHRMRARSIPRMFLIDRNRRIAAIHRGWTDDAEQMLRRKIDALLTPGQTER